MGPPSQVPQPTSKWPDRLNPDSPLLFWNISGRWRGFNPWKFSTEEEPCSTPEKKLYALILFFQKIMESCNRVGSDMHNFFSQFPFTWHCAEWHEGLAAKVVLGDDVVVHQGEGKHGLRQLALLPTAGTGKVGWSQIFPCCSCVMFYELCVQCQKSPQSTAHVFVCVYFLDIFGHRFCFVQQWSSFLIMLCPTANKVNLNKSSTKLRIAIVGKSFPIASELGACSNWDRSWKEKLQKLLDCFDKTFFELKVF